MQTDKGEEKNKQTMGQTDVEKYIQRGRQIDRETERQRDRETERQSDRKRRN